MRGVEMSNEDEKMKASLENARIRVKEAHAARAFLDYNVRWTTRSFRRGALLFFVICAVNLGGCGSPADVVSSSPLEVRLTCRVICASRQVVEEAGLQWRRSELAGSDSSADVTLPVTEMAVPHCRAEFFERKLMGVSWCVLSDHELDRFLEHCYLDAKTRNLCFPQISPPVGAFFTIVAAGSSAGSSVYVGDPTPASDANENEQVHDDIPYSGDIVLSGRVLPDVGNNVAYCLLVEAREDLISKKDFVSIEKTRTSFPATRRFARVKVQGTARAEQTLGIRVAGPLSFGIPEKKTGEFQSIIFIRFLQHQVTR